MELYFEPFGVPLFGRRDPGRPEKWDCVTKAALPLIIRKFNQVFDHCASNVVLSYDTQYK